MTESSIYLKQTAQSLAYICLQRRIPPLSNFCKQRKDKRLISAQARAGRKEKIDGDVFNALMCIIRFLGGVY